MSRREESLMMLGEKMSTVGLMAISDFPLAPLNVQRLCNYVDKLILRFDLRNGDRKIFNQCLKKCYKPTTIIESRVKWDRKNWREELVRASDKLNPSFLLFIDSDECYGPDFEQEFRDFCLSGKDYMSFYYSMVTDDGRLTPIHPTAPHCKVIKWSEGITYYPYKGSAIPNFKHEAKRFRAKTKILHYDFYTKEMQNKKQTALETRLRRRLTPLERSVQEKGLL